MSSHDLTAPFELGSTPLVVPELFSQRQLSRLCRKMWEVKGTHENTTLKKCSFWEIQWGNAVSCV